MVVALLNHFPHQHQETQLNASKRRPGDDHTNFWKAPSRFRWRRPGPRQFTSGCFESMKPHSATNLDWCWGSDIVTNHPVAVSILALNAIEKQIVTDEWCFPLLQSFAAGLQHQRYVLLSHQEEILRPLANADASDPNNLDLKGHITVRIHHVHKDPQLSRIPSFLCPSSFQAKHLKKVGKHGTKAGIPFAGYLKSPKWCPKWFITISPQEKLEFPTLFNVQGISWLKSAIRVSPAAQQIEITSHETSSSC